MKKFIGIFVVVVIIAGALLYSPKEIDEPQATPTWTRYENSDLGIAFSYPLEWGEVSYRDAVLWFSGNSDVRIGPFTGTEAVVCPFSKKINTYNQYYADGIGYCRQFENNDSEIMIEEVRIGTLPQAGGPYLTQHTFVGSFEFSQSFPGVQVTESEARALLTAIMQGTLSSPGIQDKIDTFEKVMLTLEVK